MIRQIYLVPGFFGFNALGAVNYFRGVSSTLADALAEQGVDATIIECSTQPTGSIRRRADRLLQTVIEHGGLEVDELHFVGHSAGGLDVRLLLTPGVRLSDGSEEQRLLQRTRSAVTVATPHHGTPLARWFTTLPGRHALEILSLLAASRAGRRALVAASRLLMLAARTDDWLGRRGTFLDQWSDRLLAQLTPHVDDPIWSFFRDVASDQGAIVQLTPEGMDLFNAAVVDAPHVAYGCVVTAAPPPPLHYDPAVLLHGVYLAFAGAFAVLHTLSGREHRHYPHPDPGPEIIDQLGEALGSTASRRTNDGIVPSFSQVHGSLLSVARADHLDVVGQFDTGEPHSDWLPSAAGYDWDGFLATWRSIAAHVAAASTAEVAGRSLTNPAVVMVPPESSGAEDADQGPETTEPVPTAVTTLASQ